MSSQRNALLKEYERAVKAVHGGKWSDAVKRLEKLAAQTESMRVAMRARQYLEIARQRLDAGEERIEDPFLRAVVERNRGDLGAALSTATAAGRSKKDARFALLAAGILTLQGELEAAAEKLRKAVELEPENRIRALHDPDFEALREAPEFASLFQP